MTFSTGTKLGTYEVVGPLGSGGMGEVYRARDSKLKREVAVKVLLDRFACDAERVARFQREAEVMNTITDEAASPCAIDRPDSPSWCPRIAAGS